MRILIIDDFEVVFQGVKSQFKKGCPDSNLFWAQGLAKAETILKKERIDLIISELDFQDLDGLEFVESLCNRYRCKLLIHTTKRNAFRLKFIQQREFVHGLAYKEDGVQSLIKSVCEESRFKSTKDDLNDYLGLSIREEEVLNFLLQGFNNKIIASRLQLSHKTVATYKHRLLKKLGLQTDYELFSFQAKSSLLFARTSA